MIAVVFALPEESASFRRQLADFRWTQSPGEGVGWLGARQVLVAHVGVGASHAAQRGQVWLSRYPLRGVISAGFAGGLDPRLDVGALVVGTNCGDSAWRDRCRRALSGQGALFWGDLFWGALTTQSNVVETAPDKARLARETGALAVDLETAVLASFCREAALPFLALRAISDSAGQSLPVPMGVWFDAERQRPKPGALLAYLLRNPRRLCPFLRFVRGLGPARRNLGRLLLKALEVAPPL
jgi:adenosylhomocysteine nucleosidase